MLMPIIFAVFSSFGDTGNDFMSRCADEAGQYDQGYCLGFLVAITEGEEGFLKKEDRTFCLPDDVSKGQVRRLVHKYLVDHPESTHHTAGALAVDALTAAFPCASAPKTAPTPKKP